MHANNSFHESDWRAQPPRSSNSRYRTPNRISIRFIEGTRLGMPPESILGLGAWRKAARAPIDRRTHLSVFWPGSPSSPSCWNTGRTGLCDLWILAPTTNTRQSLASDQPARDQVHRQSPSGIATGPDQRPPSRRQPRPVNGTAHHTCPAARIGVVRVGHALGNVNPSGPRQRNSRWQPIGFTDQRPAQRPHPRPSAPPRTPGRRLRQKLPSIS